MIKPRCNSEAIAARLDGRPTGKSMPTISDVDFSRELRADVLSGEITVTFRLWRTPKVKVGRRYRVGSGQIEVDSIEQLPFAAVDDEDLPRCGEVDREALRRRAAHAGPIHDDTLLYRIEFHAVGPTRDDPLIDNDVP